VVQINVNIEKITNKYIDAVFSLCYSLTDNYFSSEEITYNTFSEAYMRIRNGEDHDANIGEFMIEIASKKCAAYLKKIEKHNMLHPDYLYKEDVFYREIEYLEGVIRLTQVISNIPSPQRDIAFSYYIKGDSVSSYVKANHTSLKEGKKLLVKARKLITEKLQEVDKT
jgi:RNA polymerase sigma-70 factor (ECF subfamily)